MFSTCGIDAVLYLHFVRLMITISGALTVIGLVILVPLNIYGIYACLSASNPLSGNKNRINPINNGTIAGFLSTCLAPDETVLSLNFIIVYLITGLILFLTQKEFYNYLKWRKLYLTLSLPSSYSVLLKNLPKSIQTSQQLFEVFHTIWPKLQVPHLNHSASSDVEVSSWNSC